MHNYTQRLSYLIDDIDFVNFPVLSAVGTKVFGDRYDDATCEELLSFIIDLVDENKSIEEIVSAVQQQKGKTITEDDAMEIAKTRGVTYARGPEHVAYVTKGTTKMEIVSLFLRMMASDDYGATFSRTANGTSPYCAVENTTSQYAFVRNASKIPANRYYSQVSTFGGLKGKRATTTLTNIFTTESHIPDYVASANKASIYTDKGTKNGKTIAVYKDAAKAFLVNEKGNVIKNWSTYFTESK